MCGKWWEGRGNWDPGLAGFVGWVGKGDRRWER